MIDTAKAQRFKWPLFLRSLLGLTLAPVVGGALMIVGVTVPALASEPEELADIPQMLLFGALFGGMFGLPGALTVGWGLHLLLLWRGWTSVWAYTGLGAALGVVCFFVAAPLLGGLD